MSLLRKTISCSQAKRQLSVAEPNRIQLSSVHTAVEEKRITKFWYTPTQEQRNRKQLLLPSHPCHYSKACFPDPSHVCTVPAWTIHVKVSPLLLHWIPYQRRAALHTNGSAVLAAPLQPQHCPLLPSLPCSKFVLPRLLTMEEVQ